MLLFLILLFPCAFIAYSFLVKDKKIILPAATGFLSAVIVCACRFFFSYEHRLIYSSFNENLIYYLIKQNLLPLLVVSVLVAVITRDTWEYRFNNFFPLMCSFFAVYLPYCVITSSEYYYQSYDIFLKPIIYLAMLVQISLSLISFYKCIVNKKVIFAILNVVIISAYLIYPAISDTLYAIDYSFGLILVVGIVYSILPVGFFVLKLLKK